MVVILTVSALTIIAGFFITVKVGEYDALEVWSTFGTLISTTFGMLATVTALGTLFIVTKQYQQQEKIVEKQIDSIEFDRYDRHRRIFFERIDGIEKQLGTEFRIRNKEGLYRKIFPHNSPLRCNVKVELENSQEDKVFVKWLYHKFEELEKLMEDKKSNIHTLVDITIHLHMELEIELKSEEDKKIGDLLIGDKATPISLYDYGKTAMALVKLCNDIFIYSGNEPLKEKNYTSFMVNVDRPRLLKAANEIRNNEHNVKSIYINDEIIKTYEDLFAALYDPQKESSNKEIKGFIENLPNMLTMPSIRNKHLKGNKEIYKVVKKLERITGEEETSKEEKLAIEKAILKLNSNAIIREL